MLLFMRTTVDIPDDLAIEAKKMAAELRVPLRLLIEEGLRARLRQASSPGRIGKRGKKIQWVTVDGALAEDLELENRENMHEWLGRSEP
jgi:hypothetical protein